MDKTAVYNSSHQVSLSPYRHRFLMPATPAAELNRWAYVL